MAAHGVLLATVVQHKLSPVGPADGEPTAEELADGRRRHRNDLLRPALYQARHRVTAVVERRGPTLPWRVVGPVCESSDDFGVHMLPATPPREVALLDAGAYGFTMASQYNGRPLPAEVFVRDGVVVATRARAGHDVWAAERASVGG